MIKIKIKNGYIYKNKTKILFKIHFLLLDYIPEINNNRKYFRTSIAFLFVPMFFSDNSYYEKCFYCIKYIFNRFQ